MATKILRCGGVLGCAVFALFALSSLAHATIVTYKSTLSDGSTKPAHMALISANGADLYVPQINNLAIAHYKWDVAAKKLTFTASYQEGAISGGKTIGGLNRPWQISLSPDQRHLYVISIDTAVNQTDTNTLAVFERSTSSGALIFKAAYANGTGGITGIGAPTAMNLSADGRSLYIVSGTEQTLAVFSVDAGSGLLTFVHGLKHGATSDGLVEPSAVIATPDGRFVYVTDASANLVAIYARDTVSGALTFKSITALNGLPKDVIASRDGEFLYVTLSDKNSVATLARDAATGALNLVATVSNNTNGITALVNPSALTLSPDDTKLVVGTFGNNSFVVLRRQPITGALTLIEEHATLELKGVIGSVFTPQGSNLMTVGAEPGVGLYDITTNDLRITVKPPAALPAPGATATYQYEIKEVSGISGATRLALTARIPDGLDIAPEAPSQGACVQANRVLSCEFGGINANGAVTLKLALTPQQAALMKFEVNAFAEQSDIQPGNNTVRVSLPYFAPVARDDIAVMLVNALQESVSIDVLKNDGDPDAGYTLVLQSVDLLSQKTTGSVTLQPDGTLRYTPALGFTGADRFNYTITDNQGATASAQATVIVNTPPVAMGDEVSTPQDSATTIWVTANDRDVNSCTTPDGTDTYAGTDIKKCDVFGVTVVELDPVAGNAGVLEITNAGQYVTYTPAPGFTGEYNFTYTITDDKGASSSALVKVVVGGGVTTSGVGPGIDVNANKKKGGGSIELWSLLCLAGCIATARAHRRRSA